MSLKKKIMSNVNGCRIFSSHNDISKIGEPSKHTRQFHEKTSGREEAFEMSQMTPHIDDITTLVLRFRIITFFF